MTKQITFSFLLCLAFAACSSNQSGLVNRECFQGDWVISFDRDSLSNSDTIFFTKLSISPGNQANEERKWFFEWDPEHEPKLGFRGPEWSTGSLPNDTLNPPWTMSSTSGGLYQISMEKNSMRVTAPVRDRIFRYVSCGNGKAVMALEK